MKQRVISEETKYKISKANIGRKISDETKYKISKAKKGKRPSDECLLNARIATSKKVINTKTNEIYDSATQLAIILGMNRTTLTSQLSGRNKNSTDYIYL
jgi:CRISPR/Cas system CSM-associated protein Csm2 small subunit